MNAIPVIVIMNEQHSLLKDQVRVISKLDPKFTILNVPAAGWTYEEMLSVADSLVVSSDDEHMTIVFVSPVPALLMILSRHDGITHKDGFSNLEVRVLHNDNRVAKELPGGKIIHTVAPTGWMVV